MTTTHEARPRNSRHGDQTVGACAACTGPIVVPWYARRRWRRFCGPACCAQFWGRVRSLRAAARRAGRTCDVCGSLLRARRADARTCSGRCRQRQYVNRRMRVQEPDGSRASLHKPGERREAAVAEAATARTARLRSAAELFPMALKEINGRESRRESAAIRAELLGNSHDSAADRLFYPVGRKADQP